MQAIATWRITYITDMSSGMRPPGKSKSKSKKTLFKVGQCKQCNISSHLKWVLVAYKSMHISKVQ